MTMHLGFAGYFGSPLYDDPARAARVAELHVDERWPWPPCWLSCGLVEAYGKRTRSRKVVGVKGAAIVRESILDPAVRALELYRSSKEVGNHAHAYVHTGRIRISTDWEHPFDITGQTRAHDLPPGAEIERWLELVHELMVTVDVGCAVLPVWPTATATLADTTFGSIILDSRWRGEIDLGPGPDFKLQNQRANYWRDKLGGTYVRHPRWGTYLRRHHIERVGGLDRIRAQVAPEAILQLGELVFIQLTPLADALGPTCEAKRRAFEDLLAPIVAPRRLNEPAA